MEATSLLTVCPGSVQEADKVLKDSVIHLSVHCVRIGLGNRDWVK